MSLACKIREEAIKKIVKDALPSLISSAAPTKAEFNELKGKVDTLTNKVPTNATLIYSTNSITCSNSEPSSSLPANHIHMKY